MIRFKDNQQSGIDLSPLGWEQGDNRSDYFCTPAGAKILGWAGVDGIHYCQLHGCGSTVFAVSPMNGPGEYVHPIAGNLEILLSLLLACGDMAAIEQAWQWDRAQFALFLQENPPTEQQRAALDAIRERFGVDAADGPYGYIHELQADFDYRCIHFQPEYYEYCPDAPRPEWKVTYHQGRAGKEIPIEKLFRWGSKEWNVLAMYPCTEGLVVDFAIAVSRDAVAAYTEKWVPILRENPQPDNQQFRQMQLENPLELPFIHEHITQNGRQLQWEGSSGRNWIPPELIPDESSTNPEAVDWVVHYGLDFQIPWIFHRSRFRWATKRKPVIKSIQLRLAPQPMPIVGERFPCPGVGESVEITHPLTGQIHTLTVTNLCPGQLKSSQHRNPQFDDIPTNYLSMEYTLSPDLPRQALLIQDTAQSDSPRMKPNGEGFTGAAAIGIIGGADGPTAIFFAHPNAPTPHIAASSLHYAPVENVTWVPVFKEKLLEDISVDIL